MRFILGANTFTFEQPAQYPAPRAVEKIQVKDRAADGALQVEGLGLDIETRVLNFVDMSKADYEGLLDWFVNISNGSANSFTFEDERGDSFLVRITSDVYRFPETDFERFSGSVTLEIVG